MTKLSDEQLEQLKQMAEDLATFENPPIEEVREQMESAMRWEIDVFFPAILKTIIFMKDNNLWKE